MCNQLTNMVTMAQFTNQVQNGKKRRKKLIVNQSQYKTFFEKTFFCSLVGIGTHV